MLKIYINKSLARSYFPGQFWFIAMSVHFLSYFDKKLYDLFSLLYIGMHMYQFMFMIINAINFTNKVIKHGTSHFLNVFLSFC